MDNNNGEYLDAVKIPAAPNPYGDVPVRTTGSELSTSQNLGGNLAVEAERQLAEVKGMIFMAKQFPRDKIAATERILNDCTRSTLAQGALYSYARGGTEITGPSIRLAEVIAQNWGNLDIGIRELEQKNGESIMQAFAWDLETNTRVVKNFTVKHVRDTRDGGKRLTSGRDIYELTANQGSRRLRACILSIIPGDVVEAAVNQCEKTLKAKVDMSPEKIAAMVETFEAVGVTKLMIEKRIQCRIDAIKPAQVLHLRKIYTALKDGMANIKDFFEVEAESPAEAGKGMNRLRNKFVSGKKPAENETQDGDSPESAS